MVTNSVSPSPNMDIFIILLRLLLTHSVCSKSLLTHPEQSINYGTYIRYWLRTWYALMEYNQYFWFVEGIWPHQKNRIIRFFWKRSILLYTCAIPWYWFKRCCCLPCTIVAIGHGLLKKFWAFGTRLRSTHCREFNFILIIKKTDRNTFIHGSSQEKKTNPLKEEGKLSVGEKINNYKFFPLF